MDVGELLLSEPRKYLGVSLCNFVHWCCEYICSAFSAQQVVSDPDCGIWGIVKVLALSITRRAHNRAYFLENQFSRIVFFSYIQINYCKWQNYLELNHSVDRDC